MKRSLFFGLTLSLVVPGFVIVEMHEVFKDSHAVFF